MLLANILYNMSPQFAETTNVSTGTNSFARLITLIIIFLLVIAICYFTTKFVAGKEKMKMGGKNMQVLETTRLAPGKYIGLVKVGEKYVAIAYGKDSIETVCEVAKEELILSDTEAPTGGFSEIFRKVTGKDRSEKSSENNRKSLAERARISSAEQDVSCEADTFGDDEE